MPAYDPQAPWTDEQWARVNKVIKEEASRARLAATFLPLCGPLSADADFFRASNINYPRLPKADQRWDEQQQIRINDKETVRLATLQVKVYVRGAQLADPEMESVLALFRRAANVLARLEDAVVFRGLESAPEPGYFQPRRGLAGVADIWEIHGGEPRPGLLNAPGSLLIPVPPPGPP